MTFKNKLSLLVIVLFFLNTSLNAQARENDPYSIIDSLRSRLETIEDYTAEVEIEVDVEFIRVPVKHATIFFKKPDKIKFKSDEFIMLPKRGFSDRLTKILEEPYTAIYLGQEIRGEDILHVIRIVPLAKNPEIIVATWWINSKSYLIVKNESNSKNNSSYNIDFVYNDPTIILPTEMTFSFDIEEMRIPLKFIGKSKGMEVDKSKIDKTHEGKVILRFSDYRINMQLKDELFEDEPEETNID